MRFWIGFGFWAVVACLLLGSVASAATITTDSFGSGDNKFDITFVTISGSSSPTSGYGIVNNDYRMGIYEITNDQWSKFATGNSTGSELPANLVSWYEAAQFVNWLNTSTNHHVAYNFTNNVFDTWGTAEAAGTNLYRHRDAFYFLPTEDEWVKAAYWNGTNLQTYANAFSGDLLPSGAPDPAKWNYSPSPGYEPWIVRSGAKELNGTYDMMGNVLEWMESPLSDTDYGASSSRSLCGGSFGASSSDLQSSYRGEGDPMGEEYFLGFRVASSAPVPEPSSLILWASGGLGALVLRRRRRAIPAPRPGL